MENKYNGRRIYAIIGTLIILTIGLFLLYINYLTPYMGEDYALMSFGYNHDKYDWVKIADLAIERIRIQMTTWNVRVGEQLAIIFLALNKSIFNVMNTIVSIIYIILIFIYAFGRMISLKKRDDIIYLTIIFLILMLFQPVLGEIFFWLTGSCNYLWALSILLIFGVPLRLYIEGNNVLSNNKKLIIVHSLLGLIAGFTNENTVVVFLAIYVITIFLSFKSGIKTPMWVFTSFCTLALGFLFMWQAPATKMRSQVYKDMLNLNNLSLYDYIIKIKDICYRFFYDNRFLLIIWFALLVILIVINRQYIKNKKYNELDNKFKINSYFLIMSGISVATLILAPYIETRAFFIVDFFVLVNIIYYLGELTKEKYYLSLIIIIILSILFIIEAKSIVQKYKDYSAFVNNRQEVIINNENKNNNNNNNNNNVIVPMYKVGNDRILNTREDYIYQTGILDKFYGTEVRYSDNIISLEDDILLNSIDNLNYDKDNDILNIEGWAAISNINSIDSETYVILKDNDGNEYKFKTEKRQRLDVSNYYGSNNYNESGFSLEINNVSKELKKGEYTIGFLVEDKNKKLLKYTDINIKI